MLIALIVTYEVDASPQQPLWRELEGMKLGDLSKRAQAAGATEDEVEDAKDQKDPKATLIEPILARDPTEKLQAELEGRRTVVGSATPPATWS